METAQLFPVLFNYFGLMTSCPTFSDELGGKHPLTLFLVFLVVTTEVLRRGHDVSNE